MVRPLSERGLPQTFFAIVRGSSRPRQRRGQQQTQRYAKKIRNSNSELHGTHEFILTGSHQPELATAVCESLAGRTGIVELMPFSFTEIKAVGGVEITRDEMLVNGFMPRRTLDGIEPFQYYADYFRTYVERDARRILNIADLDRFELFVKLLAGHSAQQLNKQSLANDVGVSDKTIANWLSVLRASYIVFPVKPFYNNFGKRQTKSPKICFADTGLAAYLLGIRSAEQMSTHPLMGHLFENMVMAEALKHRLNYGKSPDLYFYRNSSGAVEVDLLLEDDGALYPREIKSSSTYSQTMSAHLKSFCALAPMARDPLVIYSGKSFSSVAQHYTETDKWCR